MTKPVYRYPGTYAEEHGELDQYRESLKANIACKDLITESISRNYRDDCLDSKAVAREVMKEFHIDRIVYVVANTIRQQDWDTRYSATNRAWAKTVPVCDDVFNYMNYNRRFIIGAHPGLTDLFANFVRKLVSRQEEWE